MTADKPAKRGRPAKAASDSQAGAIDIQAIVAAAVSKAVAETIAALVPAGAAPGADASTAKAINGDLPPDEQEEAAIRTDQQKHAAEEARMADLLAEVLPLLMQDRHRVIFDWMAASAGLTSAAMIRQVLRTSIAQATPAWRESQGMGGKSTKSAETMARLRGE